MLISDGASDTYETMFKEMNPDKKVRVFSYLIGEEVTEFREVQWMACYNRGFFVHISNLADVQGKIQHYIDIMSRPLAQHKLHTPVWTGIYYDRMFIRPVVERVQYYSKGKGMVKKNLRYVPRTNKGSRLVTTVSAPVLDTYGEEINNHTVLGVMGTSVAVETFQQLAPSYKLGANAYTFMIDNNGYVVFHPQFRPTMNTPQYGEVPKPNYNSIDILEVEVMEEEIDVDNTSRVSVSLEYNRPLRKNFLLGEKGQEGPYASLVLLDNRRRVYKQEVTAYYNGINVTVPFSLGIGVPKGADYRIEVTKTLKELIKAVEEKDFEGSNWRVHPTWVYCVPEADEVNKMDHFRRIVDTMIAERALPAGCKFRRKRSKNA